MEPQTPEPNEPNEPNEPPAQNHIPLGGTPWWKTQWFPFLVVGIITLICMGIVDAAGTKPTGDTTPAEPVSMQAETDEDRYIDGLRQFVFVGTDRELINLGYLACDAIDEAGSVRSVVFSLSVDYAINGQDIDMEMAGYVIAAAVRFLCPEHQASLDEYLS